MHDVEKNIKNPEESLTEGSETTIQESRGFFRDFIDDFKPPKDVGFDTTGLSKEQIAMVMIQRSKPKLSKRHLRMISAAGCIGTGLFIGTGNSLQSGGPAALTIGFAVIGLCVLFTMCSLGELGVRFPAPGSFTDYSTRFLHPSWGFASSWIYGFGWMVVMPLEIIAAAMTIQYWKYDDNAGARANPVAWVAIFYVAVCVLNIVGSRGYGEAEFLFGAIKVSAMIGFIIFSIVIDCGGGPNNTYLGGQYWHHPGAFAHSFKGVITVLVSSAFAYGGTEVSGLAAAETANPHRALPSAVRQVFWRILTFFMVGTLMIGLLVPYNDPRLGTSSDGSASPFVIAIKNSGVRGLPSVFNAVIMISVFSVANASVFAASRTYVALGLAGYAPKFFCYIDRRGRPMGALVVVLVFGALCFVCASDKYHEVFNWLYAFTALSFLYVWGSVCLCYIRVRRAFTVQGLSTKELLYRSPVGLTGAWIGLIIVVATLGLQFWTSLFPLGSDPDPEIFFQADLSIPVVIILFFGHMIWTKSKFIRAKDIDITTGIRHYDLDALAALEEEERLLCKKSILHRIGTTLC